MASGIKKSDISCPISVDPKAPARSYGSMRTLRRQPSIADLGRSRGLHIELNNEKIGVDHQQGHGHEIKRSSMARRHVLEERAGGTADWVSF